MKLGWRVFLVFILSLTAGILLGFLGISLVFAIIYTIQEKNRKI